MNTNKLLTFTNDTIGEIRGFFDEKTGEPWFLAGKVCDCLKLKNASESLRKLKEKHSKFGDKIDGVTIREVVITDSLGRKNHAKIINETLLYELIFQSQTKKAFEFQQWVLGEVLPSLRKRGEYRMQGKLIRRSLTDAIKESGEAERFSEKGENAYSKYSVLVNLSLGLPPKVDRGNLGAEMLEKIAHRENLAQALIQEGKNFNQVKDIINSLA